MARGASGADQGPRLTLSAGGCNSPPAFKPHGSGIEHDLARVGVERSNSFVRSKSTLARQHGSELNQRSRKECGAQSGHNQQITPDYIDTDTTIEHRLSKSHEMRRGDQVHEPLQEFRHAVEWREAPGKQEHDHEN